MNVLVTGLNGFVGRGVKAAFERSGHTVFPAPKDVLLPGGAGLDQVVSQADIIINLAGASVLGRWTENKMIEILESRRVSTRNLVKSVNASAKKPLLFINASAVGIYRPGVFCDDDSNDYADNFLSRVVRAWEEEVKGLQQVRKVILRFGMIIGKDGGALKRLASLKKKRIAVVMGSGKQEFPIIHLDDITGFMLYLLKHPEMEGVFNMAIPNCVNYREFIKAMFADRSPLLQVRLPEWMLWMLLGRSSIVLTHSAHIIPWRLMNSGYLLKHRTVNEVLERTFHEKR